MDSQQPRYNGVTVYKTANEEMMFADCFQFFKILGFPDQTCDFYYILVAMTMMA